MTFRWNLAKENSRGSDWTQGSWFDEDRHRRSPCYKPFRRPLDHMRATHLATFRVTNSDSKAKNVNKRKRFSLFHVFWIKFKWIDAILTSVIWSVSICVTVTCSFFFWGTFCLGFAAFRFGIFTRQKNFIFNDSNRQLMTQTLKFNLNVAVKSLYWKSVKRYLK